MSLGTNVIGRCFPPNGPSRAPFLFREERLLWGSSLGQPAKLALEGRCRGNEPEEDSGWISSWIEDSGRLPKLVE